MIKKFLLIVLIVLAACSGLKKEQKLELKMPPYKPEMTVSMRNDSMFVVVNYFYVSPLLNAKAEFINSINNIEIIIKIGDKLVRSSKVKPFRQKSQFNDTMMIYSVYSSALFYIENKNLRSEQLSLETIISTNNSIFSFKKPFTECRKEMFCDNVNVVELYPVSYINPQGCCIFGLFAKRLNMLNDEYLPSSEDLRVELYTQKGSLLWSSNQGKNYTMQIGKVLPDSVNGVSLYFYSWDGITNSRKKIVSGDYKLKMMIPSKPYPYFVISDFKVDKND